MQRRPFFYVLWCLYAVYLAFAFMARGFDAYFAPPDWTLPIRLAVIVLPCYILFLYAHRSALIKLDYHMVYLPILTWLLAAVVFKFIAWEISGGRAIYGPYGRDKGMFNLFVVEPGFVLLLFGIYLFRFVLSTERSVDQVALTAKRLAITVCSCAALIAVVVPPMGD